MWCRRIHDSLAYFCDIIESAIYAENCEITAYVLAYNDSDDDGDDGDNEQEEEEAIPTLPPRRASMFDC